MNKDLTITELENTFFQKHRLSKGEAFKYVEEVRNDKTVKNIQVKQDASYISALMYLYNGEFEKARKLISKFTFSYMKYPFQKFYIDCFNLLGLIETEEGNNYLAIFNIEEAIAIAKAHHVNKKLAMLYSNLEMPYEAIGDYKKLAECNEQCFKYISKKGDPNQYAIYIFNKATVEFELGHYDKSEALLKIGAEVNSKNGKFESFILSSVLLQLRIDKHLDRKEAFEKDLAEYRETIKKIKPSLIYTRDNCDLIDILFETGKFDDMNEAISRLEKINSENHSLDNDIFLASIKGRYYQKLGFMDKANEELIKQNQLLKQKEKATSAEVKKIFYYRFDFDKMVRKYQTAKKLNSILKKETNTDPLTHIPNRHALGEDEVKINKRMSSYEHFGIALADIDDFKGVNDKYGHLSGDMVLSLMGKTLHSYITDSFKVYRFGGDEFLFLFINKTDQEVLAIIKDVQDKIGSLNFYGHKDEPISISISVGYVNVSKPKMHIINYLDKADRALYSIKAQGKKAIAVWTEE